MKRLHILNGDSTRALFEKAGLVGDVFVWREMLCSGPCSYAVGTDSFFSLRDEFLQSEYQIPADHYHNNFGVLFQTTAWESYTEIILWFEYDLFCLINCCAAISFLHQKNLDAILSLVDVSAHQQKDRFVGLGEIASSEYQNIFANRMTLDQDTISLADKLWSVYCSDNHKQLEPFQQLENAYFPKLKLALDAHFKRLPTARSMAQNDLDILERIQQSKPTIRELIGHFLRRSDKLGTGDIQWQWHLERLHTLYDVNGDHIHINALGLEMLSQPKTLDPYTSELVRIYDYSYGGYSLNKVYC